MTERIDHAAEARTMLGTSAITQDAEAVTHALLALVEQQRIANLLAMSQWKIERDGSATYTAHDAAQEIRNEAWVALGLDEKP